MLPDIAEALAEVANTQDVRVVIPLHKNPVVREALSARLKDHPNITLLEPLPYLGFVRLMLRADIILSDSSGAEEEGPAMGKPTLVLREVTERHEAIGVGSAKWVGRTKESIVHEVRSVLENSTSYKNFVAGGCPYDDGNASPRVLEAIAHFFGEESATKAPVGWTSGFAWGIPLAALTTLKLKGHDFTGAAQ